MRSYKNLILTGVVIAAISLFGFFNSTPSQAEKSSLTKKEVETIIHDYIMENPFFILQAIDKYQKETIQKSVSQAMEKNYRKLFENDQSPQTDNADTADITVVEFFDYNCGYCKRALPMVNALIASDPKVRFIYKEFPILGPTSITAAKWALAANKQGKYVAFHNELMTLKGSLNESKLEKIAKNIGLDIKKLKQDAESDEVKKQIEETHAIASDLNIGGTPAFLVGEEIIPGGLSLDDIKKLIAEKRKAKKS